MINNDEIINKKRYLELGEHVYICKNMCIACEKYYYIILKYYILYLQFTIFLTLKWTKNVIIEIFSITFSFIVSIIMYKSFYNNSGAINSFWIFNYIAIHIWMNAYVIKSYFSSYIIRWETKIS
jgi:hypothetical protein